MNITSQSRRLYKNTSTYRQNLKATKTRLRKQFKSECDQENNSLKTLGLKIKQYYKWRKAITLLKRNDALFLTSHT